MRTLGIVSSGLGVAAPPNQLAGKPLFDDFLGTTLDRSKWTLYDRLADMFNGEVNCCTPSNVAISGSMLQITGRHEDHVCGDNFEPPPNPRLMSYTSGQIAQATQPFLYGTIEVRAKIPPGTGFWPCIWMLGHNWQPSQPFSANVVGQDWPNGGWCEIDIAEFMQGNRTQVNCAVHYVTGNASGSGQKAIPYNATTRFQVYRLQWTATSLIWSVDCEDGVGYRTLHTVTGGIGQIPQEPMYVVLNMAIGGVGGGTVDSGTFPQTMEIDYVRIT